MQGVLYQALVALVPSHCVSITFSISIDHSILLSIVTNFGTMNFHRAVGSLVLKRYATQVLP